MAVTFATDTVSRAGALYVDFPENILVEPELNGRHEHTEIEDLAADIEKNGQMSPVGIRKNDQGKPTLVYGHRRYRAISLLNSRNPTNPRKIVCNYFAIGEDEAFAMAIGENRFRRDVSPIDDCANITVMLRRFGKTLEDIAAVYFPEAPKDPKSLAFVKQRAALAELAPEAAVAVREGRVKLTAAVALSKLTKDQQRAKVKGEGKVKGSDIKPPTVKVKPEPAARCVEPTPATIDVELRRLVCIILEDVSQTSLNDDEIRYVEVDRESMLALSEYMYA